MLIGSYVDNRARVVSVSIEQTRARTYLVVKDRWRAPLLREGASIELEFGSPANARLWAECEVLAHGGRLGESGESLLCGRVVGRAGKEALTESRRGELVADRFLHVPAPRFAKGSG